MVARLIVEEGDLKGLSLSLDQGDSWLIGRDPSECQLVIGDPLVSRKHLVLRRTDQGIVVENLSTTSPTLLNDEEIWEQEYELHHGDTLKVGKEVLRFYAESSAVENGDREFDERESLQSHQSLDGSSDGKPLAEAQSSPISPSISDSPPTQDTIFGEEGEDIGNLAEIDFGVIETGRWLLKVIGGPNNGAEFYMQANNSYVIGTDPKTCDIVFHDTSVSRQHARITITSEETLVIEDLKSRNGVLINGTLIENSQELAPNTVVTLGTTSFAVYDREGEMQTIISPLLPSIVKVLQQEPAKTEEPVAATSVTREAELTPMENPVTSQPIETPLSSPPGSRQFGPYIILSAIIGLFVLAGMGTTALFHEKPIVMPTQENVDELIQQALSPFPAVRWTFNKSNGSLLLLGHVSTLAEKNQLLYHLANLKFVKSIDDNGIILDEGVWSEVNSLLANNPEWKGITIYSPTAGQFILSGELQTRKQAEQLSAYLSLNFPYLDLLQKQIVVEEDVVHRIHLWLQQAQLPDVEAKMESGKVALSGVIPPDKTHSFNDIVGKIKQISGVRMVSNQVHIQTAETGIINISDHYPVTGKSRVGSRFTVVIHGRILSEGDDLDGMTITKITSNRVELERNKDKFRIDY